MIKYIFLLFCFLFFSFPVVSQELKGHIMDAKQRPVKNLKVWRKNTTESLKTDKMGVFSFSNLLATDTLVISVSKKEEAIIPVKDIKVVSIKLEKEYFMFNDGKQDIKCEYSRIKRVEYNSNVLTREQILKLSASSIYELLKGTIPGVMVSDGPNGMQVSVRGGNSFDLDTEPLFVVDGTQYESSRDADSSISVNDIEKIEVLKDGSPYGIKGANGAIIITTIKK